MLFLVFQIGKERYALEASRVVEVLPLLTIKPLPQAPKGVAGLFNYRGQPVPAVDLSEITSGKPASELLSTRIIVIKYPDSNGRIRLLGLIAERATGTLNKEMHDFVDPGLRLSDAPYLGPLLLDNNGPIHWLYEQRLLSEPVRQLLCSDSAVIA